MNSYQEIMLKSMFLMILSMIILILFNKNISPLNLMMTLIMFTLITLIMNYLITQKTLYCFMIFISMISGNMIMFLYFTSLINNYYNKLFKSMIKYLIIILLTTLSMIMIYFFSHSIKIYSPLPIYNIHKIYTHPLYLFTLMMILYLLLTLMLSMKMCLFKYKPLRKIIN